MVEENYKNSFKVLSNKEVETISVHPNFHLSIFPASYNFFPISAPIQSIYLVGMPGKVFHQFSGLDIPQF